MRDREKGILALVAALLLLCLIDFGNQNSEHPVMNLPPSLSVRNWSKGGSCVIASMVDLLRWQGKFDTAARLRSRYSGGQTYYSWRQILDSEGIRYASTYQKSDVGFLERAIATRRGCMVGVMPYSKQKNPQHMVCLVDLTLLQACILDNNDPKRVHWVSREAFLDEWYRSGSWALTPVYTPTSPRVPK